MPVSSKFFKTKPQFYLYHTLGCHLCEEAEAMLVPMFTHFNLTWEKIDIAEPDESMGLSAAALVEQWGLKIPVIQCTFNQQSLCWPFSEEDILRFWEQVFNENS